MAIISAKHNTLTDNDGNQWLDLQSGILNTPFGHGTPMIDKALREVAISGLINTYDRISSAQEELLELMAFYKPGYTWKPFNTGAEAIEKAIQIAATYFKRLPRIAVLPNAFHGKMLSMAYANYGAKLPWGNPLQLTTIDPSSSINPPFDVLIYEPIQGWDGTVNDEIELRALCDERNALLIADEMITGFMRCGERFMSKTADIIVCGKGISAGVPLSMLGFKPHLLVGHGDTIAVGWRTTGAGNNLAMVIGRSSLEILIDTEKLIDATVYSIEKRLRALGFNATGAFGFKSLRDPIRARSHFENRRIIASWHYQPQVRVGPSFVTTKADLDILEGALEELDEL